MGKYPDHADNLVSLKRIEGQVRGIQRMIEKGEYCVDILNQIHAAIAALARVEDRVLEKHFAGCVTQAVKGSSAAEKKKKLKEILQLIHQYRKVQ
jgi:DNA-binding FrmR family transcriptional regulator